MIIFNEDTPTNSNNINIEIVQNVTYLGVTIINKKNWHREHINKSLDKGQSFANNLYSTIGNSCNRMLIRKTYWKALALSSILYCKGRMVYRKEDLDKFQRIENKAFRTILQVPTYTAVEFLRGEFGASFMMAIETSNLNSCT